MDSSHAPTRRFQPEPMETTTTRKTRKFVVDPVETTTKTSKRFTPQHVETSTKSSKTNESSMTRDNDASNPDMNDLVPSTTKLPRRFGPEPVESSTRSSKAKEQNQDDIAGSEADQDMMEPTIPKRRRFAPEPVESIARSNRKKEIKTEDADSSPTLPHDVAVKPPVDDNKPRRRFAPQMVEGSIKSSRHKSSTQDRTDDTPSPSPSLVDEVHPDGTEATTKPARRKFAPQPIESTTKTSRSGRKRRDQDDDREDEGISMRSSLSETSSHRKFAPQLVESTATSSRSSRRPTDASSHVSSPIDRAPLLSHEMDLGPPTPEEPRERRKFAPQLVETASRSRKSGDTSPAVLPHDKTNVTPATAADGKVKHHPHVRIQEPSDDGSSSSSSKALGHATRTPRARQHSYMVPSLPAIDSSESEESRSPSVSMSHREDSDTSDEVYKDATRRRESADERYSGYLLDLAARAVEKQLRDQAAAAFANSDYHEPVAHYVDRSDSDDEVPSPPMLSSGKPLPRDPTRRDSADEKQALKEMQRHGEHLKKMEQTRKKSLHYVGPIRRASKQQPEKQQPEGWVSKTAGGPFAGAHEKPKKMIGGHQRDGDLKQMRKAASPPMLGGNIEFPRCASPDHARFDVTQGADFLRKQMCYLTEQTDTDKSMLWSKAQQNANKPGNQKSQASNATDGKNGTWMSSKKNTRTQSPTATGTNNAGGLWGGFCTDKDARIPELPSGLQTPHRTSSQTPSLEKEDPFSVMSVSSTTITGRRNGALNVNNTHSPGGARDSGQRTPRVTAASPPSTATKQQAFAAAIDARFALEAKIDSEFDDAFVTQLYNYLSLGYPALARKYDEELSRIGRTTVDELRMDDKLMDTHGAKGHIRFSVTLEEEPDWDGEAGGKLPNGIEPVDCRRWRALRKYVREWGRQMLSKDTVEGIGGKGMLDPHRAWGLPNRRGSWGL